ncbi:MAG TPA: alpha/beta fold hydrolase [Acidimicrobiales bacterium]|nr:alpha/beta fold hydrolase [Acidimicrobiales bacterium]
MDTFERDGLTFEVSDTGPAEGRVVIALHGFPEDRHCWDPLAASLAGSGYRTLAPDQRGYSPGARPTGRRAYTLDLLTADVLALADEAGATRFDLVGHDWGAALAWYVAANHPDRIRTLTALSVPHLQAFLEAMTRSSQALHSWYMAFFQIPKLPEAILRRGGEERFVAQLRRSGLDEDSARRYARRAASPGAMTGPLNWYRALPFEVRNRLGPVTAPTLFVWGDSDPFITRVAAERCARQVSGPFRFETVVGGTHWLPTGSVGDVAPLLLEHLAATAG